MTGFSAEWLALREPADHAARSAKLRDCLISQLGTRDVLRIVDLGCGTGSNLRALAPALRVRQEWLCVDYDQDLLDEAARHTPPFPVAGSRVTYLRADLREELPAVLSRPADLVTAAAFFDLWSQEAIVRFAAELAVHRLPLYTVLTYNGIEHWEPPHPADPTIHAAFVAHQLTDKGFGPAAGPHASLTLITALQQHGYQVRGDDSPCVVGDGNRALIRELVDGIAGAVSETGMVEPDTVEDWRKARHNATGRIGHMDILALPG